MQGEGKTVFFSTHIVSDLEKCADDILFIRDGRIALDGELHDIERSYSIIDESTASPALRDAALGRRRERDGATPFGAVCSRIIGAAGADRYLPRRRLRI